MYLLMSGEANQNTSEFRIKAYTYNDVVKEVNSSIF